MLKENKAWESWNDKFMIKLKDSHELCHRTHALFKLKQVVVTYIRTLPSTPSQLPACWDPFRILGDRNTPAGRPAPPSPRRSMPPIVEHFANALLLFAAQSDKGAAVRGVHPSDGTPQPDQESRAPLPTRRLGIVEPRAA